MKKLILLAILGMTTTALAGMDPVKVGDIIRFYDRPGDSGGEFGVRNNTQTIGSPGSPAWVTFCVQRQEYLDFDAAGFKVVGITNQVVLAGGGPLSSGAAYLYTRFRAGTLLNVPGGGGPYTYDGDAGSANALQNAIWKFEGESNSVPANSEADAYYQLAVNAINGGWTGIGNVRVANIVWATARGGYAQGQAAQDVLVIVPAPAAALLGLIGLGTAAWTKRRVN